MDNYHFWQDFFDTYQSSSPWLKGLIITIPPAFLLGLLALIMHHRIALKTTEKSNLIYTVIHRDQHDFLHIYQHGADELDHTVFLLDQKDTYRVDPKNVATLLEKAFWIQRGRVGKFAAMDPRVRPEDDGGDIHCAQIVSFSAFLLSWE